MFSLKSASTLGALALAVLLIGTAVAQAADNSDDPYGDCLTSATKVYQDALQKCAEKTKSQKKYNTCAEAAQTKLVNAVVKCEKYLTFQTIDPGVGGPTPTGLDGWHPKGKKTQGQADPSSTGGASGQGGTKGGSEGLKGTFNRSFGAATMSRADGNTGGIIL